MKVSLFILFYKNVFALWSRTNSAIEHDVDLFEQEDLYDINIVGSMFKAWLRELPDELFPRACQDRISKECAGAETVPQLLVDELSNLPPFNYYLLFAITCHLSLLLAHQDKNKMDFRNLCICFQPCMKIDRFCFKFLVENWRDCWQGCKTEPIYIEQEYALFERVPSHNGEDRSSVAVDDRPASSSNSSKQSSISPEPSQVRQIPNSQSNSSSMSGEAFSPGLKVPAEAMTPRRSPELALRPLSPIKPLSPLGF
jgi:hypothetical protein